MKLPNRRGSVFPTTNAASRTMKASGMACPVGIEDSDGSALDGTDGKPAHEMALNEKHDHHDGQHDADGARRRYRPVADVLAAEGGNGDGQRFGVNARQHQGKE